MRKTIEVKKKSRHNTIAKLLNVHLLHFIYCLNKCFYAIRHSSDVVETTNVETKTTTKTEMETGKFRELRFDIETRKIRDRDRNRKLYKNLFSTFLIILKTINFFLFELSKITF